MAMVRNFAAVSDCDSIAWPSAGRANQGAALHCRDEMRH
jgi:hypothetical protein